MPPQTVAAKSNTVVNALMSPFATQNPTRTGRNETSSVEALILVNLTAELTIANLAAFGGWSALAIAAQNKRKTRFRVPVFSPRNPEPLVPCITESLNQGCRVVGQGVRVTG